MTQENHTVVKKDRWAIGCYTLWFLLGVVVLISGRIHATYWGPTEGANVRVGGALAMIWSAWGLWKTFNVKKKTANKSSEPT